MVTFCLFSEKEKKLTKYQTEKKLYFVEIFDNFLCFEIFQMHRSKRRSNSHLPKLNQRRLQSFEKLFQKAITVRFYDFYDSERQIL